MEKTRKVGAKRVCYIWRVIAVMHDGRGVGDCGHNHATQDEATACQWAPPGWDDMPCCDLLVREFRDPRIDRQQPPTKRQLAARQQTLKGVTP